MSSRGRVLVIDDEQNITTVIQAMLERAGLEALVYNDSSAALKVLEDEEVDAVVTDLYMPGPGGMDILAHCARNLPHLPVVLITAYGTVDAAVSALKSGAFDFITKPFEQADLLRIVENAVATSRARATEPISLPATGAGQSPGISSIVGQSAQMQEIFRVVSKIAPSPSTVLITGESGTGKELVAIEIHRNSPRAAKPFVKINCAAIPAALIESELFGHERGAFTGAVTSKPGRFELAHEGTLFLDEVADMPLEMQVKLLRVLQEQEFERVGGVSTIRVDARIIAATNRDIQADIKAGRFREDLYYRLNVVPIHLPPLRERREDIEPLIRYFLAQFNTRLGREVSSIDPVCLDHLIHQDWPGNIRQLENVMERLVLMTEGTSLKVSDLPEELRPQGSSGPGASLELGPGTGLKEIVRARTVGLERELIEKALEETGGNVTRAAEKLGLSRKGLQLKMKELGIKRI